MEEAFVDANVFLRFLLRDDEKKANAAKRLFGKALNGEILLKTNELVIAEIVWTLESFYKIARQEIEAKVQVILQSEGLEISHSDLLGRALVAYRDLNVDFIDAYNAVWSQQHSLKRFLTYDRKHLKRFDFLEIAEP